VPLSCAIEAPDAFAAFLLARALDAGGARTRIEPRGPGFRVALDLEQAELPHTLRVVQDWLHDESIRETVVRFGGRAQLLRAA
jgi:hypothetical protein